MKKTLIIIIFFFPHILWADDLISLQKKADNGDPIAQNNLGWVYLYKYNEHNIEKNTEKGSFYIRRAAEQNQVNAMATVGWNSFTGEDGFIKNDLEAIYWNEQASNLGFAISSHNLGFFYYSGLTGLEQDLLKAQEYWILSVEQWSSSSPGSTPDSLLEEINFYNNEPNEKMILLRDAYINCLLDFSLLNLYILKSVLKN